MPLIWDFETAFSGAQCDALVALMEASASAPGPVYSREGAGTVDPTVRNVATALKQRSDETGWIFERLDALFAQAGEALGVGVGPLSEPVQLLRYGPGGHFDLWHSDAGYDVQERRRISVSVELSETGDYEGGVLEIVPDTVGRPRSLPRGGARFFRSAALHRLTRVSSGTRYALVAWTG